MNPRVGEILHTAGGDKPSTGEEVPLFFQVGLFIMALWRPSRSPAPGIQPGQATSPKPRDASAGRHQGLTSSTARAALEACVAQEVKGSETQTQMGRDGPRMEEIIQDLELEQAACPGSSIGLS